MNLNEFGNAHGGLRLVIRRHLQSRKVAAVSGVTDKDTALALRLGRHLDDAQQGLSAEGTGNAFTQGRVLFKMGLTPAVIVTGTDQRNLDGGQATAEGIRADGGPVVPVYRNPGITYPYYAEQEVCRDVFAKWGDLAIHRHISGKCPDTRGLWSETVVAFGVRLEGAVNEVRWCGSQFRTSDGSLGFELWDLNFEQMVWLHHRFVVGSKDPAEIACEHGQAHDPPYGGGIVFATDNTIARFNAAFEITD